MPTITDGGAGWIPLRKSHRWTGAETGTVLWAPPTGARIYITDYIISTLTAGVITLYEETDTDDHLIVEISAGANGGAAMPHLRTPIRLTGGGRVLLDVSAGTGSVTVYGYETSDQ